MKVIEEEEAERLRKKRLAEYEFQIQNEKIKRLMNQEITHERRKTLKFGRDNQFDMIDEPYKETSTYYNVVKSRRHMFGDMDMELVREDPIVAEIHQLGLTESELDNHCIELFEETPIKFKARKGNKVDEQIMFYIEELDIKFPIQLIKDDLYLIGCQRLNIK